jgi:hypothetical protein
MTPQRIAGLCVSIVLTSAAATAQQATQSAGAQEPSTTTVTERTFPSSGFIPLRRVERKTASGGSKVLIETVEATGIEGNWQPLAVAVTETAGSANTASTRRDVFGFDAQRQPTLLETTETEQSTTANGNIRTVGNTWTTDINGHRTLAARRVEETRAVAPGLQQTDATLILPTPDGFQESERTEHSEHQVAPTVIRHESRDLVRDLNGRFQPIEARSGETRGAGSAERISDETIQAPDLTGTLALRDRVVTRTSESKDAQEVVIDTYSQGAEGFVRSDSRLALLQRVRRSTTLTADGGRNVIEEVEARNPMAPNDPMHVVQRTVVSVRKVAPDRWRTERQVFNRDVNGRFVLVANETGDTTQ